MKKQNPTASAAQDKKMKFAEAGVLFVIVFAITVFVGVRLVHHNQLDNNAPVIVAVTAPAAPVTSAEDSTVAVPAAPEVAVIAEPATTLEAAPPRVVTYATAEQAYFDENYDDAVDQFDAYTDEHPGNAWGYYMLGLSAGKAGDSDAAEEAFVAALALKPDHVKSLINYGRVLLAQDRLAEARIQIDLALAAAPANVAANRLFSRLAHNEGRLDDAVQGYQNVLQMEPNDVWSLNNLGLVRIQQERFEDALAPLARAASLDDGIACIQNNLGVALERTGHLAQAVAAYERALDNNAADSRVAASLERVAVLSPTDGSDNTVDLTLLAAGFMTSPPVTEADISPDLTIASNLPAMTEDTANVQADAPDMP